jgi:hypothetical protein
MRKKVMYIRISIDTYFEKDFDSIEEAKKEFLDYLKEEVDEDDFSVEKYNEETEEWE